jgi:UDP-2,3-diacylglucosamine pyrophosphatase LpxH
MFSDKNDVWKKLSALKDDTHIPVLEIEGEKYALLSDLHLGNGGKADDFTDNETALVNALDYYLENAFRLILLGDIEELWQFDLDAIQKRYDEKVYKQMRKFSIGQVTRIFGNHDYEWGGYVDPILGNTVSNVAPEAVKLKGNNGVVRFLLVHGHQGSIESDKYSWISRFGVRLFSFVEPFAKLIGVYTTTTATKSQITKDYERTRYQWAKENQIILICGHSHRAIFASKSHAENLQEEIEQLEAENSKLKFLSFKYLNNLRKIRARRKELKDEKSKGRLIDPTDPGKKPLPCYFNTGCGVYSDGLTAIEIEPDAIRLVKWNRDSAKKGKGRKVYQEEKLSNILSEENFESFP